MFKPFFKEEKVLNRGPFLDYEVQFNLFHYIVEGKELIALKTSDDNAIALQNSGHAMWLWVNEKLEKSTMYIHHQRKEKKDMQVQWFLNYV